MNFSVNGDESISCNCRMSWSVSTNACESFKSKRRSEFPRKGRTPIVATLTRFTSNIRQTFFNSQIYFQVDQLGGDLTSQWEQSSKLQLDLERMKRIESDQKRDLASKTNQIEELKQEIKMRNTEHLSDLTQMNAEKHSLEQEISSFR